MTAPDLRSSTRKEGAVQANGGEQVELQDSLPVLVGEHLESGVDSWNSTFAQTTSIDCTLDWCRRGSRTPKMPTRREDAAF